MRLNDAPINGRMRFFGKNGDGEFVARLKEVRIMVSINISILAHFSDSP